MSFRRGLSYLEVLACVTIIGVLSLVIVPRLGQGKDNASRSLCELNRQMIEMETVLFARQYGRWPKANLSDIADQSKFFPDGLPKCPVDESTYTIDVKTGRVNGHQH
ncbi:type II secretion system GspH family protein [Stieleria sp. JC731]|uniref:competence type IV pilus major pilin ComGC n=1 Tax=Pirellulaceae TaxID=2691357 RepID=UPI001E2E5CE7|nr:type II secretion system protein [Stieleria sp. JC731]MCC9601560.1 type II secretion system GspH family protein [Stieleria sp. JC731]